MPPTCSCGRVPGSCGWSSSKLMRYAALNAFVPRKVAGAGAVTRNGARSARAQAVEIAGRDPVSGAVTPLVGGCGGRAGRAAGLDDEPGGITGCRVNEGAGLGPVRRRRLALVALGDVLVGLIGKHLADLVLHLRLPERDACTAVRPAKRAVRGAHEQLDAAVRDERFLVPDHAAHPGAVEDRVELGLNQGVDAKAAPRGCGCASRRRTCRPRARARRSALRAQPVQRGGRCRALIEAMVAAVGGVANRATTGAWCASPCARSRATRPTRGAWRRRRRCPSRWSRRACRGSGPRGRENPLRVHRHVLADPQQARAGAGARRRSRISEPTSEYTWPAPCAPSTPTRASSTACASRSCVGARGDMGVQVADPSERLDLRLAVEARPADSRRGARSCAYGLGDSTAARAQRLQSCCPRWHSTSTIAPYMRTRRSWNSFEQAAEHPHEREPPPGRAVHDLLERASVIRERPAIRGRRALRVPADQFRSARASQLVVAGRDEDRGLTLSKPRRS